ncbi:hypothetical protein Tco_0960993 [Tanacetum coccineum]
MCGCGRISDIDAAIGITHLLASNFVCGHHVMRTPSIPSGSVLAISVDMMIFLKDGNVEKREEEEEGEEGMEKMKSCSFLRSSAKLNLLSSSNLLSSCALVKKNMKSEFAEALTPL